MKTRYRVWVIPQVGIALTEEHVNLSGARPLVNADAADAVRYLGNLLPLLEAGVPEPEAHARALSLTRTPLILS